MKDEALKTGLSLSDIPREAWCAVMCIIGGIIAFAAVIGSMVLWDYLLATGQFYNGAHLARGIGVACGIFVIGVVLAVFFAIAALLD